MKRPEHVREAKRIGNDSWELFHFAGLPRNASVQRQVDALHNDQVWLLDHINDVCSDIDTLIRSIQEATPDGND